MTMRERFSLPSARGRRPRVKGDAAGMAAFMSDDYVEIVMEAAPGPSKGRWSRIRLPFLLLIVTIPLAVNGIGYFVAGGQHPNFSPLTIRRPSSCITFLAVP
jgi:hypothetical protein